MDGEVDIIDEDLIGVNKSLVENTVLNIEIGGSGYDTVAAIEGVDGKTAFTPRQSASSFERLANQMLHLGRDEVSDWLDAQRSTMTALV
ncbi:hypothetical protein TNCV_1894841 [Trichonephila clavipes]|nr:hypothetical protein TNCV_1894841 [Trichonephila clavipes]